VFVDCGCYDLETTEIFIDKCPDYKKVICFEPDEVNRNVVEDKIRNKSIDRVELYPYGVWKEKKVLCFGGNGSSAQIASAGGQHVQVVAIDEVIKEKVTFIKMDIEGAELDALDGAKKIIARDKPKLAICVYHKSEDIVSIPQYLLELVPEYKFYLRHYSNFYATETVLYAVL
jgi:FkbM family methyltransferase